MANRRDFLKKLMQTGIFAGLTAIGGTMLFKTKRGECDNSFICGSCGSADTCDLPQARMMRQTVWQLDPAKCIQCGQCQTECVLTPSAVKCVHVFAMCGYCDLCGGYFKQGTKTLNTGAENMLCPTNAIKRTFIEEPFFQYTVDESLCNGCGKCVKGCAAFGNGSLQLQVRHDRCSNCNECSIARKCPSGAFTRVPAHKPYLLKGFNSMKTLDKKQGAV
jgi:electron transport complex protein RnfB